MKNNEVVEITPEEIVTINVDLPESSNWLETKFQDDLNAAISMGFTYIKTLDGSIFEIVNDGKVKSVPHYELLPDSSDGVPFISDRIGQIFSEDSALAGTEFTSIIAKGKSKTVYNTNWDEAVLMEFRDDITAGDGEHKDNQLGKGAINCAISKILFRALDGIVPNHYLNAEDNFMLVQQGQVVMIETIFRFEAAGSFCKRYGVEEGSNLIRFNEPLIEFCIKDDALGDPVIGGDAIMALGLATATELTEMRRLTMRTASLLKFAFSTRGIKLIDGKLEYIRNVKGRKDPVILADELSPDSFRLRDAVTGESLDKDIFRKDGESSVVDKYQAVLNRLQA